MKITKLVIGIFTMVFFLFIILQSCAAGALNAMSGNSSDISGRAGVFLALFMLIGGIISVSTRKDNKGCYSAGAFYLLASIIGFSSLGTFGDLVVWSSLSLIFAVILIIFGLLKKKSNLITHPSSINVLDSSEVSSISQNE